MGVARRQAFPGTAVKVETTIRTKQNLPKKASKFCMGAGASGLQAVINGVVGVKQKGRGETRGYKNGKNGKGQTI